MGHEWEGSVQYGMNGFNLGVWYDTQSVPAFTEDAHKASCLAYLDVAGFIHDMPHKQVAWEHRDSD
jgi:hypothetical protein